MLNWDNLWIQGWSTNLPGTRRRKKKTEGSGRTSLTAGYCCYRRCVNWLTGKKKRNTEIVQSLAKSQARFSHWTSITYRLACWVQWKDEKEDTQQRNWQKLNRLQAWSSGIKTPKLNKKSRSQWEETQLGKWEWPVTFCCRGKHQGLCNSCSLTGMKDFMDEGESKYVVGWLMKWIKRRGGEKWIVVDCLRENDCKKQQEE